MISDLRVLCAAPLAHRPAGHRRLSRPAGYAFGFGLGVNVGWKHTNVARIESETVGFLLTYAVKLGRWPG